ncbi:unnamed protein product (mitochondrion) [Plasmodiophora brassicae]|uniref:Uncharacterized protein n=1 Tax=Plasmodiophora brassicae TaxID=37360 RepID=A0A0G4J6Y5_PLABS|nr:hypothetical protein PBRA_003128 [Plasmodiophora brassicae]SPQ95605.1 unnamed protein product [Plasmodiophora brassicae]
MRGASSVTLRWVVFAAALAVMCLAANEKDASNKPLMPSWMREFINEEPAKRDLHKLRSAIIQKSKSGTTQEAPPGRTTVLPNGFHYKTDSLARVARVYGVFPSLKPKGAPSRVWAITSTLFQVIFGSSLPAQTSSVDAKSETRLRPARQKYTRALAAAGLKPGVPTHYHAGHIIMHSHATCDHPLNLLPQHPRTNLREQAYVERLVRLLQKLGDVAIDVQIQYPSTWSKDVRDGLRSIYMPLRYKFVIQSRRSGIANAFQDRNVIVIENPTLHEQPFAATAPERKRKRAAAMHHTVKTYAADDEDNFSWDSEDSTSSDDDAAFAEAISKKKRPRKASPPKRSAAKKDGRTVKARYSDDYECSSNDGCSS